MGDENIPPDRVPFEVSHPHLKEFIGFLPELNKESYRGCVMVACSYLDELLRRILLAFLVEVPTSADLVVGFNAPLGTMSTRTAAAYSLGLIHEREFKELEILRRVRNRFAHGVHVSFDMQDVKALCQNLTMAARSDDASKDAARALYTTAAVSLILNLTNRPGYVARQRRKYKDCPIECCNKGRFYPWTTLVAVAMSVSQPKPAVKIGPSSTISEVPRKFHQRLDTDHPFDCLPEPIPEVKTVCHCSKSSALSIAVFSSWTA
jgi:mannitol operon repressor